MLAAPFSSGVGVYTFWALLGVVGSFWLALALPVLWALIFAAHMPIRQAYPRTWSRRGQRATALPFDSLMGSSGVVVIQPMLARR
jgi:hypothetical protein